jgi:hypothetical protein
MTGVGGKRKSSWTTLAVVLVMLSMPARAGADEQWDRIKYGSSRYDGHREVAYWGQAKLEIYDYRYGLGDAESLELVVKTGQYNRLEPVPALRDHFMAEFRRLFGRLPFHDLEAGREERWKKFFDENRALDDAEFSEKWGQLELARRRDVHPGRAGSVQCIVKVQRRKSPVLYEIGCGVSPRDDLKHYEWEDFAALGFSAPEQIVRELKRAITEQLREASEDFEKARKYSFGK